MTDPANVIVSTIDPDEYKKNSKNFLLIYGTFSSKFGKVLAAIHDDKICYISFVGDLENKGLLDLRKEFPNAVLTENNEKIAPVIENVFASDRNKEVKILLKGTQFETEVWKQLVNLKKGSTYSYEHVAKALNNPKAIRAVAKAVTKNKLAYCVPCHRVISKNGGLSKYKWGADRKMRILKEEKAI